MLVLRKHFSKTAENCNKTIFRGGYARTLSFAYSLREYGSPCGLSAFRRLPQGYALPPLPLARQFSGVAMLRFLVMVDGLEYHGIAGAGIAERA